MISLAKKTKDAKVIFNHGYFHHEDTKGTKIDPFLTADAREYTRISFYHGFHR